MVGLPSRLYRRGMDKNARSWAELDGRIVRRRRRSPLEIGLAVALTLAAITQLLAVRVKHEEPSERPEPGLIAAGR